MNFQASLLALGSSGPEKFLLTLVIGVLVCIFVGIQAVVCGFLSNCLKSVPEQHRMQAPGMVWLLLIPLVNFAWAFFVYPKIADSFKSYFASMGRADVGDCGRQSAMTFCVLACCGVIPYVGVIAGLAALVIGILLLIRFGTMKSQVLQIGTGGFPVI